MHRRTALLGSLGLGLSRLPTARAATPTVPDAPVVLELFTSQGCSSCPPADALLGVLSQRPSVIALAWHVDYWNALGWRDPYASRKWTERQRAYASRLRDEVYTPALVVNGAAMVVGSNRPSVEQAIRSAPPLTISTALRRQPDALAVSIGPVPDGATALLVTYEAAAATPVRAGENAGRQLREYRIVREARMLDPAEAHQQLPPIPPDRDAVLLIQDQSLRVLGAADTRVS